MHQLKSKRLILSNWIDRCFYKYLLIIFLALGGHLAVAQTTEIDSLRGVLSTVTSDTERMVLMNELGGKLIDIDIDQALPYAENALQLSRQINDKKEEVKALYNMGKLIDETPKRIDALVYFQKSERLAGELGLRQIQADNLINIAAWYQYVKHDSAKTVDNFLKSAEISKVGNYPLGAGRAYARLASFYIKQNQINLSEEYLALSAKHFKQFEFGLEKIAHYYNEVGAKIWDTNPKKSMEFYLKGMEYANTPKLKANLAKAHSFIGEPKIALDYLNEAIPYFRKMEKPRILGIALAQLAEVYIQLEDYNTADKICAEGITLLAHLGRKNQRALPIFYRVKGIVAEQADNDKAALAYYTKSVEEAVRIKFRFEGVKSKLALGKFYLLSAPEAGIALCKEARSTTQKSNYPHLEIEACDCIYNGYKITENSSKALYYFEQKVALLDSMSTLKIKYAIEINGKITQKDKLIAKQAYQKKIKEEQLKNQKRLNYMLFLASIMGLFLIGFLSVNFKKIKQQNIEITRKTNELGAANLNLNRSNEELERFAYVSSHDLKSPLTNIINFNRLLRKTLGSEIKPVVTQSLDFIENSGKRMTQLIEDILEYSRLSNQNTYANQQEIINLNKLVKEISELMRNNLPGKSINIEATTLPSLKWNYLKFFILFKNLIENGLKYNESPQPMVKLYFTQTEGVSSIYIQDNGIGIKQEYFDKIFVIFQRLHNQNQYEGTGLGLATCKKIVDEFEGNISLSSEFGKGTTFKIDLPDQLIYQHTELDMMVSA